MCWILNLFGEPSTDALIRPDMWHWLASGLLELTACSSMAKESRNHRCASATILPAEAIGALVGL